MAPTGYIHEDQYCMMYNGSQVLSPTGLYNKRAVCRYHQAGNCRRGSSCPFAHLSVAAPVETSTLPYQMYQAEHMFAYHPLQTPVYRPLGPQTHPTFLWQAYLPPSPLFDPRYGLARQPETKTLPDYPDDESDPSSAESSSTATSMDHQPRTTLDTVPPEKLESGAVRDIGSPSGDFGINPSPEYAGYRYPVPPAIKADFLTGWGHATSGQCLDQGSVVTPPSPCSLPWQDDMDNNKKQFAYKTKPCKFYATNGKCTSREKCTFIHDPESIRNADKSPIEPAPPSNAKLPSKPRNKYDDSRAKDFYPITWRVIGGGVMMGGQRQICPAFAAGHCQYGNDCKLAHETELHTDQVGFIELKDETVRKADESPRRPAKDTTPKRSQRRKTIRVPFPETQRRENVPSTTLHPQRPDVLVPEDIRSAEEKGNEMVAPCVRDTPTSPVHRRTQSMSMVLTSPPPPDTTHSSYAAEL